MVYAFDKYKSLKQKERISERELHTFAVLGGFLGASLAMALFHHKVSKASFLIKHVLILILWIGGVLYYFLELNTLGFLR